MFGRKGLKPGENAASPPSRTPPSRQGQAGSGVPAPLSAAADYIGFVSPGEKTVSVNELSGLTPCSGPQGAMGVCFLFTGLDGVSGKIYFFPSFASIWVDGEAAPRAQIPTEMIANRIPNYMQTLQALIAGVESRLSAIRQAMTG